MNKLNKYAQFCDSLVINEWCIVSETVQNNTSIITSYVHVRNGQTLNILRHLS